jgi:hypothetical protein
MPDTSIVLLSFIVLLAGQSASAQDPHAGMHARAAGVMGFDQDKTAHHFSLFDDGGAIEIAVKDAADTVNRDAIRAHLPHIAERFGAGSFEAPVQIHGTKEVPGIAVLTALKSRVAYKYAETPNGGRVDITSSDPVAVAAVHDFLKYQIAEHKTGDSTAVGKRK